ncbi:MAG: hypothetical protein R3F62_27445 [Planctomycetota bacterium]
MAALTLPRLEVAGPASYLDALLAAGEALPYLRLQRRPLAALYARLEARATAGAFFGGDVELARTLVEVVHDLLQERATLDAHLRAQEALIRDVEDRQALQVLLLETARTLGAGPLALRADAQALGRDLDWPGMRERARHRANLLARHLQVALLVLRNLVQHLAREGADRLNLVEELMLAALDLFDRPLHPLLARETVRLAGAILTLEGATEALPCARLQEELLTRARDPRRDVWVQCSALEALAHVAPEAVTALVERRLTPAEERFNDTLFVRRHVLDRLEHYLPPGRRVPLLERMLAAPDPSPHVRQGVLLAICGLPREDALPLLGRLVETLGEEPVPQVRAALPVGIAPLTHEAADFAWWDRCFDLETDPTSLQIGLALLSERLDGLLFERPDLVDAAERTVLRALARGHRAGWPLEILRLVEELLERVRVVRLPSYLSFKRALLSAEETLQPGDDFDLVAADGDRPSARELGRLLAWFSQGREGLYALPHTGGFRVTYGFVFKLRVWRLLHETGHPAPDKRPAHSHVRGRHYPGTLRAHSSILAEQSPTKVPGEPIVITSEGGWRPFLPLVDDFLDALDLGPVELYAPQGRVWIVPPAGRRPQWAAWWRISRRYPQLAALRDQCRLDNPEVAPCAYVDALRELGFEVGFEPFPPPELCTAGRYFEADDGEAQEEPALIEQLLADVLPLPGQPEPELEPEPEPEPEPASYSEVGAGFIPARSSEADAVDENEFTLLIHDDFSEDAAPLEEGVLAVHFDDDEDLVLGEAEEELSYPDRIVLEPLSTGDTQELGRLPGRIGEDSQSLPRLPGALADDPQSLPRLPGDVGDDTQSLPRLPGALADDTQALPRLPGDVGDDTQALPRLPGDVGAAWPQDADAGLAEARAGVNPAPPSDYAAEPTEDDNEAWPADAEAGLAADAPDDRPPGPGDWLGPPRPRGAFPPPDYDDGYRGLEDDDDEEAW